LLSGCQEFRHRNNLSLQDFDFKQIHKNKNCQYIKVMSSHCGKCLDKSDCFLRSRVPSTATLDNSQQFKRFKNISMMGFDYLLSPCPGMLFDNVAQAMEC